jgi:glycosyltransferase involved in cell wall biosynthesis
MKQAQTGSYREFTDTTSPDRAVVASVIVAALNCATTLGAQLDALRQQSSDVPWEVIVVDNGSADGTRALVEQYRDRMPNLRLVRAPDQRNISYARNVGVENAKGEMLLFCDGDDIVAPGWLSAMIRALTRHQFVVGRVEVATLNDGEPEKYGNNGVNPPDALLNFLPYAIGCTLGVSRCAYESVGGFSTTLNRCMDVELSWRLQLAGYSLHEEPEAEVYYRYRKTAWLHWKSAFHFSQAHAALYKRYAAFGAKRTPIKQVLARYRDVAFALPRVVLMTRRQRISWAFNVGVTLGRLWGSLRYMTFYP